MIGGLEAAKSHTGDVAARVAFAVHLEIDGRAIVVLHAEEAQRLAADGIRDLLAVDIDVTALLPQDDATEGFDNIADALGTSPSLIQGYISAAMKISRRAP